MDRSPQSGGLETLRERHTGLRDALELAQSEQASAVRELAESIRAATEAQATCVGSEVEAMQAAYGSGPVCLAPNPLFLTLGAAATRIAAEQDGCGWGQILWYAIRRAFRILRALERLRHWRANVAQIRQLLRLTKNRILSLLRQLCSSDFPAVLVLIQKSWFLGHGEHPPKLLTVAIPACF